MSSRFASHFLFFRASLFLFTALFFVLPAAPLCAQGAASTREAQNARIAPLENPEVMRAVEESGVYVEPSMRNMAPPQHIAEAVKNATQNSFPIAVLVMPPSWLGAQTTSDFADGLHRAAHPNKDGLAIVIAGRDVALAGSDLDDATREGIIESAARTFDSESYAAGIAQMAAHVAEKRRVENESRRQLFAVAVGGICGGAYWLFRHRRRIAQRTFLVSSTRASEAVKNLVPRCEKLSADIEYSLLGEDDASHRAALQLHQGRLGEALARAQRRSESAQTLADWKNVESESENLMREYSRARNVLRRLPQDYEAENEAAEVVEVPPLGSDLAGARVGFALDFFTSKPAARVEMAPVDLTMNAQRRRVWAARDTAARVLAGETQVAVLPYGNSPRAWFDVPHYNPWTDSSETLEMLLLSEVAASMREQNLKIGGCYIGFGRDENGWFSPDYIGWNGGPPAPREALQTRNTEDESAASSETVVATPNTTNDEKMSAPARETFEAAPRVLDVS